MTRTHKQNRKKKHKILPKKKNAWHNLQLKFTHAIAVDPRKTSNSKHSWSGINNNNNNNCNNKIIKYQTTKYISLSIGHGEMQLSVNVECIQECSIKLFDTENDLHVCVCAPFSSPIFTWVAYYSHAIIKEEKRTHTLFNYRYLFAVNYFVVAVHSWLSCSEVEIFLEYIFLLFVCLLALFLSSFRKWSH